MNLLTAVNPYMLYIKLAVAAAVIVGAFGGGWIVRGWKADSDIVAEREATVALYEDKIEDYKKELKESNRLADEFFARWNKDRADTAKRTAKLEEELRNAKLNEVKPREGEAVNPDEPFNRRFVWLWNVPIDIANGVGGGEADTGAPAWADTTAARLDREDLLRSHAKLVDTCGTFKKRLDEIMEWDRITFQGGSP